MKWQVGTIEDLLKIGVNRLTVMDWFQQLSGMFSAFARYLWVAVILTLCLVGHLRFQWLWWVAVPLFFVVLQVKHAHRIPHRDRVDVLYAFLIIPSEAFAWLRAGWFTAAWIQAPVDLIRGRHKDRWGLQYRAEAFRRGLVGKLRLAGIRVVAASGIPLWLCCRSATWCRPLDCRRSRPSPEQAPAPSTTPDRQPAAGMSR